MGKFHLPNLPYFNLQRIDILYIIIAKTKKVNAEILHLPLIKSKPKEKDLP